MRLRADAAEAFLLCELAAASLVLELALWLTPLDRLIAALSGPARRLAFFGSLPSGPERLADLVALAARLTRRSCLVRSLLLFWLLKVQKQPARLRIGVAPTTTTLRAHAWVEIDGRAIGETPATRDGLTVLAGLGGA
jgi:hypothetical protein